MYAEVANYESKRNGSLSSMLDQSVDLKKFEKMHKHNAKSIAKPRGKSVLYIHQISPNHKA